MNCFDWHNQSSDYLDGTLTANIKKDADEHLDSCKSCNEKYKHYRIILSSIASQPRSSLPVPIRKSPLTTTVPKLDVSKFSRSRWESIPWYIRTTIEGTGIVLIILLGISTGPKIRSIYERSVEKSMREFTDNMSPESDAPSNNVPLSRGKLATLTSTETTEDSEDAYSGEDESAANESDDAQGDSNDDIHVGNSEIWRFNLKTDSPHEIRPKIVQILTELKIPATTPGVGGIEAPGGIQFDLFVPKTVVPNLKRQLQKIAPRLPDEISKSPMGEAFTWYKNKSRKTIPQGKTRVVIWLSQM